ncbi:hypothetical protein [Burkholderia territorii]|uniref:hypothetical protein n=1 Tax=Burkholderia territorii TaxID=1503055 RepID=UPI00075ABAAE|nr:hypothetical protein [Burkholderia territorii]KWO68601.1 hypothetical protein WT98_22400 [Burkholderia territorii]
MTQIADAQGVTLPTAGAIPLLAMVSLPSKNFVMTKFRADEEDVFPQETPQGAEMAESTENYGYELLPRPAEQGGGWLLRLLLNGRELGRRVFPPVAGIDDEQLAVAAAHNDALARVTAWLSSIEARPPSMRPKLADAVLPVLPLIAKVAHGLPANDSLAVLIFELDATVARDIVQMRFDLAHAFAATGDFHHHFWDSLRGQDKLFADASGTGGLKRLDGLRNSRMSDCAPR